MEIENKKYDAFISYRHAQLDKFVAETIHKQLEKFKIPRQIRKDKGLEKKSICIFRDQDELPLSSNLADPITDALKNSKFLIVICSPRLKESEWCKREIETFISLHGRNHIFTILAEGEPADSFPEQLLYEEVEEFDANGNIVIKNKSIEPLAADVRGDSFREVKRKIKHELLRVLAPMFGLGYDDLKQRHKERVMKHAMAISAGITAAVLGFSGVSTYMALEIQKQSDKITEQNDKILEQNQEISLKAVEMAHQSEQIKKQYEEAQTNYSKSLADASARILNQGDRMSAIYTARSGMPASLVNPEKPYTTECEKALTDALFAYGPNKTFIPYYVYQTEGNVRSMKASDDGSYLLVIDSTYQIYLWETKTNRLIYKVQSTMRASNEEVNFLGKDKIIYESLEGMRIYNFLTQEETCLQDDVEAAIPYPDGKHYLTISDETIRCYNMEDSSLCFETKDCDIWTIKASGAQISEDMSRIMLLNKIGTKQLLLILDGKTGDILYRYPISFEFASTGYKNGKLLLAAFQKKSAGNFYAKLVCFDVNDYKVLWKKKDEAAYLSVIDYIEHGDEEYFYIAGTNKIKTLDAKTGELIANKEFLQSVTNSYEFTKGETELVLCDNGALNFYDIASGSTVDKSYMIEYTDYQINETIWKPGALYIQPKNSTQVLQYKMLNDNQDTVKLSKDDLSAVLNSEMSYLLNEYIDGTEKYIGLKNVKTGKIEIKLKEKDKERKPYYFFIGDGQEQFAVIDGSCTIYSVKDGTILRTIEAKDGIQYFDEWSSDGRMLYTKRDTEPEVNLAISTETGQLILEMPEREQGSGITTVYSNDQSLFACYGEEYDEVRLYHQGDTQPYVTKQVSLTDTRGVLFSDDGNYLCIISSNGNASFYEAATMELKKTLYDVNISSPKRLTYFDTIQRYILSVSDGAYMLNEDFDIVAIINNYYIFNETNQEFIIHINDELFTIPYYSYDALVNEADQLLEGYTISNELKRKYNVE